MSRASDRKRMIENLAGYSLMGVPQVCAVLDCSEETLKTMVDRKTLRPIMVGKRWKFDPVDVAVYMLAQKDGISSAEYWERYGPGRACENARNYFVKLGMFAGAA